MKKYRNRSRGTVSSKELEPAELVGHESEKFTDLAVAFRSQVSRQLCAGNGGMESLKRANVRQLLSVREFALSPAASYLDRSRLAFISWRALTWRMAEANEEFKVECMKDAERWRRSYAEDFSLDIEAPG